MDKGSLVQLRNALDRRNVSAASESDFNACDDFFNLVVECHILAAAMEALIMDNLSDKPTHHLLNEELWLESDDVRKDVLSCVTDEIVRKFVDLEPNFTDTSTRKRKRREGSNDDKVQQYACEVLSNGLLYMEFADSIREGDGDRILLCWRFFMLIFKVTQRKNYSVEALNLLSQYHFFLSPRQKEQLIWSRCINTHGLPGRNILCDLHMEHLNRVCANAVGNLCANKSNTAIERAGKCVGVLSKVGKEFDEALGISDIFGNHSTPRNDKDIHVVLQELKNAKVFQAMSSRQYQCKSLYNKINKNLICNINKQSLDEWMKQHLTSLKNIY
jgi:L1 cell adhesion molecule like protein